MSPTPGGTMVKMTHAIRMELADAIRDRYAAAANKDKSRILEEFIAATGYHEKSAIRILNASPEPKRRQTRRRPSLYDEAARGALIVVMGSFRPCLRQASQGTFAHPPASAGAQWTSQAGGRDTSQDPIDER